MFFCPDEQQVCTWCGTEVMHTKVASIGSAAAVYGRTASCANTTSGRAEHNETGKKKREEGKKKKRNSSSLCKKVGALLLTAYVCACVCVCETTATSVGKRIIILSISFHTPIFLPNSQKVQLKFNSRPLPGAHDGTSRHICRFILGLVGSDREQLRPND